MNENETFDNVQYQKPDKPSTLSIVAFVMGIVGFFLNPCYIVSFVAVVLSIISLISGGKESRKFAIGGLCLGIVSCIAQIIFDLLMFGATIII